MNQHQQGKLNGVAIALRNSAVLLGSMERYKCPDMITWRATAFIVAISHERVSEEKNRGSLYLVTAEHCTHYLDSPLTVVRFFAKDGGMYWYMFNNKVPWVYLDGSDVAATPINIPHEHLQLQMLPLEALRDGKNIGIGGVAPSRWTVKHYTT